MIKKKWVKIGGAILGIALLINYTGSLFGDPMDGVYPEIKKRTGYEKQDLQFLSYGHSYSLFGERASAEFHVKGEDKGKIIRISVRKHLHLIPWQVQEFENNS